MVEHEQMKKLREELKTYFPDRCVTWKEIDSELKLLAEIRKILASLTTSDTQKIDKIDLLLSEGGI